MEKEILEVSNRRSKIISIDPRKIKLLEVNARYMKHETYQRLVSNIKKDGELEQDPFCAYIGYFTKKDKIQTDEQGDPIIEAISGNHRVMAAIDAGLDRIDVKLYSEPLPQKERIAKQLAHNAINGDDDPAILKQLYEMIEDIDLMEYAGLDDKTLEMLEKISTTPLSEANLDFQTINVVFLPTEVEKIKGVLDDAKKSITGKEAWFASMEQYDSYLDSLNIAGGALGVKNIATSLMAVLAVFERHITDLSDEWIDKEGNGKKWIPLSTIIGTDSIPVSAGTVIKRAVDKMRDEGVVKTNNLWQALEFMSAEYLSGH